MPATFSSDVSAIAKFIYVKPGSFEKQLTKDYPLLKMLRHETGFATAEGMKIPIQRVGNQGFGITATLAASHSTPVGLSQWLVPQKQAHQFVKVDNQVVRNASAGSDATQLLDAVKLQTDSAANEIGREISKMLHGSASGSRGTIATISIGANTTFTMVDASLIYEGMIIVLATTETGAIRSGGTTNVATVSKVDLATNTVTFTGQNFTTLFGTAAIGDHVFREGDAQNNASAGNVFFGLKDWNPTGTVSATAFCGVDRTLNRTKLAGTYYDGSQDTWKSVFIKAEARGEKETGRLFEDGVWVLNPVDLATYRVNLESTARVVSKEAISKYEVGIKQLEINGHTFMGDPHAQIGVARYIGKDAMALCTAGNGPQWGGDNPLIFDPKTGFHEGLMSVYGNIASYDTSALCAVTLPTN